MGAIGSAISKCLNFHSSTGRRAFGVYAAIWIAFSALLAAAGYATTPGIWGTGALVALGAVVSAPMPALIARRLHDAGQSGVWALLFFAFGLAITLIAWVLPARTPGRGRPRALVRHRAAAVLVVLVTVVGLGRLIVAPIEVTTTHMSPTLLYGDYALVTRGRPARGDVVLFENSEATAPYISRAIAFEGEVAGLLNGGVLLNGQAFDQFDLDAYEDFDALWDPGGLCSPAVPCRLIEEVLPGGASYLTLDAGTFQQLDSTIPRQVPPGHVYVLGDHRDNSLDSRLEPGVGGRGPLPLDEAVGIVRRVLVSVPRGALLQPLRWRWDRTWKDITP